MNRQPLAALAVGVAALAVRVAALAVGLAVLAAGCRDVPTLFDSPELEPLGPAPFRLTFNLADDRAPTWVGGSDSLLYLAENPANGLDVLRVIHREGGPATVVFPELQGGSISITLESAVADPVGGRVAMLSLLSSNPASLCAPAGPTCVPSIEPLPTPSRLDSALVRVRTRGETGPPDTDPSLLVRYEGRLFDSSQNPSGLPGVWVIDLHPFQSRYNMTRRPPTQPSWSPDGDRLVFSDGLHLSTWDLSASDPQQIPGTEDGIRPAWSPTGEWIAYEHLQRGIQSSAFCEHRNQFGTLLCAEQRTQWPIDAVEVMIARPDGSETRVLASGSGPTWSGDGQRVFYTAPDGIRSVALDGSDDMAIAGTEAGDEPAVSPDGRWLAFSRSDMIGRDVWIVELEP